MVVCYPAHHPGARPGVSIDIIASSVTIIILIIMHAFMYTVHTCTESGFQGDHQPGVLSCCPAALATVAWIMALADASSELKPAS